LRNAVLGQLEVCGAEVGDELAILQDADINLDELPSGSERLLRRRRLGLCDKERRE